METKQNKKPSCCMDTQPYFLISPLGVT